MGLEMIVERGLYLVRRHRALEIEMGDLAQGMDTRIGTTGALDRDAFAAHGEDRLFEKGLDRGAVGLALPADEWAAIVFDDELVARHRISPVWRAAGT